MFFTSALSDDDSAQEGVLDRVRLPWLDSLGKTAQNTFVHDPTTQLGDASDLTQAENPELRGLEGMEDPSMALTMRQGPQDGADFIDSKTLNAKYGQSLGLTFDKPTRKGAVAIMVRRKQEQIQRDAYLQRAPDGVAFGIANFATMLAVSATDPLNIASAFIPVVSQARMAIWTARYGKTLGRATTGAVEGAVGAAVIEPAMIGTSKYLGDDYDMGDSLMNVAVGTALGGGLHVGFGAISDRLSRAAPETREAALRGSVANMAEGRGVEIDHILATDPRWNAPDYGPEQDFGPFRDAPSLQPTPEDIAAAASDIGLARSPLRKEPSLFQQIKDMGGISLADATGTVTREGSEVKAVLKDIKRPGLISKKGRSPDYMREALREMGWLGRRDDQGADLQELYDMLGREASGEKVYHPESPIQDEIRSRAGLDEELGRAGVAAGDTAEIAAEKLAKWRVAQAEHQGSALAYWRQKADEFGVEHRATDTPEEVMADVIEAHALRAERSGFADDAEARLREHLDRLYPELKDADLEREFQAQEQRSPAGASSEEGGGTGSFREDQNRFGGNDPFGPSNRQNADPGLDRARTASADYGANAERSTAVPSREASENADRMIREAKGDDIDTELTEALATVDAFEKQGALTPEEAAQARSPEAIQKATQQGNAADAAARCLLLHP